MNIQEALNHYWIKGNKLLLEEKEKCGKWMYFFDDQNFAQEKDQYLQALHKQNGDHASFSDIFFAGLSIQSVLIFPYFFSFF